MSVEAFEEREKVLKHREDILEAELSRLSGEPTLTIEENVYSYRVVYGASDYPKSFRSDTAYLYGSALNRDEIKSQGMEINPLILTSTQIVHTLGTDFLGRTLIVIYTHRKNDIRLISARAATNAERKEYEQRRI